MVIPARKKDADLAVEFEPTEALHFYTWNDQRKIVLDEKRKSELNSRKQEFVNSLKENSRKEKINIRLKKLDAVINQRRREELLISIGKRKDFSKSPAEYEQLMVEMEGLVDELRGQK